MPVFHKQANDLIALLLQQIGGNARVYASRKPNNDTFSLHGTKVRKLISTQPRSMDVPLKLICEVFSDAQPLPSFQPFFAESGFAFWVSFCFPQSVREFYLGR